MNEYSQTVKKETERIQKQILSGYLSKKKICNMQPLELIENKRLINEEIARRGLGMLFGV